MHVTLYITLILSGLVDVKLRLAVRIIHRIKVSATLFHCTRKLALYLSL